MTGVTAGSKDFIDAMTSHAPLVFAFVLGLAFILLLVTFRSIVVPIKAIVLNLLSVGAAYGILVLVFQDGHGEKLLDFQSVGGIAPWIPLFLFVILFGLSMDYHVFILSRVREAVDRGMSNDDAVAHGIKSTAGVVTSAALVMVAVFGSFALASDQLAKQIGVGLAAAILIDATIIRAVLLPATMKLLGERNWYLPKRLGWLPKLEHEPSSPPPLPEIPRAWRSPRGITPRGPASRSSATSTTSSSQAARRGTSSSATSRARASTRPRSPRWRTTRCGRRRCAATRRAPGWRRSTGRCSSRPARGAALPHGAA